MAMYQGFGYRVTLVPDAELAADPAIVRPVADRGVVVQQAPFAASTAHYIATTTDDFTVIVMARHTSGGRFMEALRDRWPAARLVFHPGDLHFLREERAAALLGDTGAMEDAAATRAPGSWRWSPGPTAPSSSRCTSRHCWRALGWATGSCRSIRSSPTASPPRTALPSGRGLRSSAGTGTRPMSMRFIICVPRCGRALLPPGRTSCCASSAARRRRSLPATAAANVVIDGRVLDLDGLLDTLRLTIAPLRYGGGGQDETDHKPGRRRARDRNARSRGRDRAGRRRHGAGGGGRRPRRGRAGAL